MKEKKNCKGRRMLWIVAMNILIVYSTVPVQTIHSTPRGKAYQISRKPCWVDGIEGTCMFVWECIKTEGYHIGMCVDAFMFGSCCAYNTTENTVLPNITPNNPSVLFTPPSQNSYSTKKPIERPLSSRPRPTRPTQIQSYYTTNKQYSLSPANNLDQSGHLTTSPPRYSSKPESTDIFEYSNTKPLIIHTKPGWQSTTEPGFITKVKTKPGSNYSKGKPTKKPISLTTGKTTLKEVTKSTTFRPKLTTTITTTSTQATSIPPTISTVAILKVPLLELSTTSPSTLNGPGCGLPQLISQPQTRIVGGKNAPFGRWPWQVSVRRTSFFGFSSTHRCGGAILNENWIATAGHCVDDLLTSQIRIRVGEYDFSTIHEELPYVERAVAKKIVHPKYNFFTYEYDLALVQLDKPLKFAPHISPICLPASDDLLIGENATVTGWGRLSEGGTLPSVLQEVQVPIVSNDRCKSMFLRAGRHEFIPEIFLCAGHETGGQDSCQGDSGGPLQVRGKDGRYFLAGIISWGIGCAEANLPGVCTRISKFVPWILNNVT